MVYIFAMSIIFTPIQGIWHEKPKYYKNGQFIGYLDFGMRGDYRYKPQKIKLGADSYEICVHSNYVFSIMKNDKQIARINFTQKNFQYLNFCIHYDKNEDETFIVSVVLYLHHFFWQPARRGNGVRFNLDKIDPYPERAFWLPEDEKI